MSSSTHVRADAVQDRLHMPAPHHLHLINLAHEHHTNKYLAQNFFHQTTRVDIFERFQRPAFFGGAAECFDRSDIVTWRGIKVAIPRQRDRFHNRHSIRMTCRLAATPTTIQEGRRAQCALLDETARAHAFTRCSRMTSHTIRRPTERNETSTLGVVGPFTSHRRLK
jgi:hypothetical protein